MEMLFQIFTRNYKIRRGIINFASQGNFKQTFVYENRMPVFCGHSIIYKNTPFLMEVRTRHLKTKT